MLSFLVLALLLTSCAEAPEEVKNEKEMLDNNSQVENVQSEYAALSEIRENSQKELEENQSNVTAKHILIGDGDSMPAYKITPYNDNFEELNSLTNYLFGLDFSLTSPHCSYMKKGEQANPDNADDGVNPHSIVMFTGNDNNFSHSLIYHETGYSFFNDTNSDDPYRFTSDFPTEKWYKLNEGEKPDDVSYTMLDGNEWSVSDATKFAQDFCDTYFAPLENNEFQYVLTDIKVKNLDDSYGYIFDFQRVDNSGNLYDNHTYYSNYEVSADDGENWIDKGIPFIYTSSIQLTMNNKEKINSFYKSNTPYVSDVVDKGEKLLTLKSAMNIVSEKMAGKVAYSFETAELEYYYVGLDCPDWTNPQADNPPNADIENMLNNADIELRPYWAFTMENCYPDVVNMDSATVNSNCLYLVDAISGELYVY